MQVSQVLQGQFQGIHDLTFFENSRSFLLEFLISLERIFHIFGPKYRNAFKPNLQISVVATKNRLVNENCNLLCFFYRSVEQ